MLAPWLDGTVTSTYRLTGQNRPWGFMWFRDMRGWIKRISNSPSCCKDLWWINCSHLIQIKYIHLCHSNILYLPEKERKYKHVIICLCTYTLGLQVLLTQPLWTSSEASSFSLWTNSSLSKKKSVNIRKNNKVVLVVFIYLCRSW